MADLKNLKHLLPDTRALLQNLVDSCDFLHKYVLSGGSALALYIGHRKSEALDFFSYEDSFNKKEIFEYIDKFDNARILNQTNEQVDVLIGTVKLTFFNAKWSFLKPKQPERFNLATIESIAAMKVNVLFLRAKYRDYYDLYFLIKRCLNIKKVFECGLSIMPGINFKLFATALIYVDDIEDDDISFLEPIENLSKNEIREFFQNELKKIPF
jgi:predicted nucleotidyltransferase component of viral defense system